MAKNKITAIYRQEGKTDAWVAVMVREDVVNLSDPDLQAQLIHLGFASPSENGEGIIFNKSVELVAGRGMKNAHRD